MKKPVLMNASLILALVAAVLATASPALADMIIRTHDGRTYRVPISADDIKTISFSNRRGGRSGDLDPNRAALRLNKFSFHPGEDIRVSFTTPPGYAKNAWIGIVPAHVEHGSENRNDRYDMVFKHLNGKRRGTLYFKAPKKPGRYDFRMHDKDNGGRETAYVTFTVR
jgi:hypothetical protein